MKKVVVFCGSSTGFNPVYKEAAIELGNYFALHDIALVYGGGKIGMMGTIADTILGKKGEVIGIIPELLKKEEVVHGALSELIVTKNMSDRKVRMSEIAEGYITLPGGFGTLDELFEVLTLIQTRKITKVPVILIGNEYWGGMIDWIRATMAEKEQTIAMDDMDLIPVVDTADEVLQIIREFYDVQGHTLAPNYKL